MQALFKHSEIKAFIDSSFETGTEAISDLLNCTDQVWYIPDKPHNLVQNALLQQISVSICIMMLIYI